MDAGVHLPLIDFGGEGFSYGRLAGTVDAARDCGFAAVSANDHFVFPAPWLDGPTALAAVAGRSGGMKLVTTLALATLRGPVPLAKALSALDILSGGQLIAGVGPGSSEADYQAVGMPFEQRWQRFEEAVGLLRALLGPGTAARGGSYYPRRSAAGSRCGSGAGGPRPACAASPVSATAGSPPRTTPPRRPSRRPGSSSARSSADGTGHPAISRTRWPRCGPGSPTSAPTRNGS